MELICMLLFVIVLGAMLMKVEKIGLITLLCLGIAILSFINLGLSVIALLVFVITAIYIFMSSITKEELKYQSKQKAVIDKFIKTNKIPDNASRIKYYPYSNHSTPNMSSNFAFLWYSNSTLYFADPDQNNIESIPISNIISFSLIGQSYNQLNITGGGGGGSSIASAIVGGVVAGAPGAIIGSRKKINPIKSENVIVNNRQTVLHYKNYENKYLYIESQIYDLFLRWFPNKEK